MSGLTGCKHDTTYILKDDTEHRGSFSCAMCEIERLQVRALAEKKNAIMAIRKLTLEIIERLDGSHNSLATRALEIAIAHGDGETLGYEVRALYEAMTAANEQASNLERQYSATVSQLTAREAELLGLKCTIKSMLDYRQRNTVNFQLEKLDDYLNDLRKQIEESKNG